MDVSTFTANRRTLRTAAGDIAYTEWGSGPAAVFVHGLSVSGAIWRHVIEQVRDTTRCIAIDLPGHGGTPPRADVTVTAMAQVVADLCESLGLDKIDLVGSDTGGAIAQLVATRHPELLRTFTLTNCDTEGNFPPPEFAPIVELARQGGVAPLLAPLAQDPLAARESPLGAAFEHPEKVPDDAWREYVTPIAGDAERARYFERIMAAFDQAEMAGVNDQLSRLEVPMQLVWGTGPDSFGVEWAYKLRDLISGARVIEVDGAKIFYPEERPDVLIAALHELWGR
jgi:pimeloyl-ACP methyl ester carboxylesterase